MATDFTYNNKTITISGPAKPSGKNQPLDPRTEVKLYADIESIPSPYIGMIITVLEDETNSNKMTDYKVLSLKANASGIANSVVDQVQRYVDYLGAGSVSQDDINTAVNNYLTEHPVAGGATAEQAAQIEANRTAIGDSNSGLTKEINNLTESLSNVDAVSLNGKKFSEPMTKQEYDAIVDKDPNTIYLIDDNSSIIGVPDFTQADTGKYLAVNSEGTALAWVDAPSGSGTPIEIVNDLTTGGINKALSAEQGVVLKGSVSSIETRVSAIESVGGNVDTSAITSLVEIVPSNNLFDYTQIMKNYSFTNASGSTVTGNFFKLPIANGEKYATNLGWKPVHFFKEDDTHIKTQMYSSDNFVIAPINEAESYCLITLDNKTYTNNDEVKIILGTNLDHYYDSYSIIKTNKSRWNGKKWLVIGDSITFERKGENGDLANKTYAGIVAKELGFKYYINEAIGGKTYDYYNNKLNEFISDYDLVTVMLGTNDHGYGIPIGTVDDTTSNTISGRVDIMINKLISKNPDAVIAFMTPIKRVGTGDSASFNDDTGYLNKVNATTKEVADAIVAKCKKYSIPCLNLYDAIEPLNLALRKKYFINAHFEDGDGTHPNQNGHAKYIAPKVKNFIENIAPFEKYYENTDNPQATLSSISAVYTQGDIVIYPSTSLDSLKSNLVVTANYSDGSTSTVTNYSLSGTLSVGSSTITVTYGGKTATFNVTVTQAQKTLTNISAVYNQGSTAVYPSTNLDSLKNNLTVTATYSDNSTSVISSGYSLSGNLTVGTSTITVTYSGKTTTFEVTVSEEVEVSANSLIFDFTGKSSETTSLSSTGTLAKDLTVNAGTFDSNGLIQGKTISFNDSELMNNFNNTDFLFMCKYKCDNAGVAPIFINSSSYENGYLSFMNYGIRNKFEIKTGVPSFYQERFVYIKTYERPEDTDINNEYHSENVSADNKQIPYDTNEHTLACAYIKSDNLFKVYVDGVYKDTVPVGSYVPNWSGLLVNSNGSATIFYKVLLQDYVPSDDKISQLMSNF